MTIPSSIHLFNSSGGDEGFQYLYMCGTVFLGILAALRQRGRRTPQTRRRPRSTRVRLLRQITDEGHRAKAAGGLRFPVYFSIPQGQASCAAVRSRTTVSYSRQPPERL